MRENIYIRKENEAKWSQLPNKSGWVNSMLETGESKATRRILPPIKQGSPTSTAALEEASGFGAKEPCNTTHYRIYPYDCEKPNCKYSGVKYGAGK